jgi:hypothetical protein
MTHPMKSSSPVVFTVSSKVIETPDAGSVDT